jgi:hypothetical protein
MVASAQICFYIGFSESKYFKVKDGADSMKYVEFDRRTFLGNSSLTVADEKKRQTLQPELPQKQTSID